MALAPSANLTSSQQLLQRNLHHTQSVAAPLASRGWIADAKTLLRSSRQCQNQRQHGLLQVQAAVKKAAEKNVVCSKTLVAAEGSADRVQELCESIMRFSRERMQQRDNGILEFTASQDNYESGTFHFWERYLSNAHMGRHNSTPEMKAFMEDVQEHLQGPIGMGLYEWKNGQIGVMAVQGGPKGEGGLDDASGASGMSAGASMKQSSSTLDLGNVKRGDEGDSWGMGFKFPWQKEKEKEKKK